MKQLFALLTPRFFALLTPRFFASAQNDNSSVDVGQALLIYHIERSYNESEIRSQLITIIANYLIVASFLV